MGSILDMERSKRIERNSKILKEAEQSQPLKKSTIETSKLGNVKGKKLNYRTSTSGLFGVGKL